MPRQTPSAQPGGLAAWRWWARGLDSDRECWLWLVALNAGLAPWTRVWLEAKTGD